MARKEAAHPHNLPFIGWNSITVRSTHSDSSKNSQTELMVNDFNQKRCNELLLGSQSKSNVLHGYLKFNMTEHSSSF